MGIFGIILGPCSLVLCIVCGDLGLILADLHANVKGSMEEVTYLVRCFVCFCIRQQK